MRSSTMDLQKEEGDNVIGCALYLAMPGCLPSHQVDSGCTASARAFALPLYCPCTAWFLAVLTEPPLTTLRYISSTTVHSSSSLAYNLNSQPSPFVEQTLGDEPLQRSWKMPSKSRAGAASICSNLTRQVISSHTNAIIFL